MDVGMSDISNHKLAVAGLVAFIISGLLFLTLIPYILIKEFGFWISISVLVVMWLFLYVAMIIGAVIYDVSKTGPRTFADMQPRPRRARVAKSAKKKRSRKR